MDKQNSKNIFLFHCWGGNNRSCWSGYLEDELAKTNWNITNPNFPNSTDPILEEWLIEIRKQVNKFKKEDNWILAGHSLGCPAILRLLESFSSDEKAKAIYLVAGFHKDIGIPQIKNFVEKDFVWEKIKKAAEKFVVINSDNDPFIPLDQGIYMARRLGGELIVEKGAGHINEGAGFTKYPKLLNLIEQELQNK